MTRRKVVQLSLSLICLVGAVWLFTRQGREAQLEREDFPEGTPWICQACQAEFTRTVAELAALRRQLDESEGPGLPLRVPCPECDSAETVRAIRCPFCARFFPQASTGRRPVCTHCNKPMPPLAEAGD